MVYRPRVDPQDSAHKQEIGARLAAARHRRDMTQPQVAEICGVTKATVSGWEKGRNYPDLGQFAKLVRAYRVSADELLHGTVGASPRAMEIASRLDAVSDPAMKRWAFAACESAVVNAEEHLSRDQAAGDEASANT